MNDPVLPVSFELLAIIPLGLWAALLFAALLTIAKSISSGGAARAVDHRCDRPPCGSFCGMVDQLLDRAPADRPRKHVREQLTWAPFEIGGAAI